MLLATRRCFCFKKIMFVHNVCIFQMFSSDVSLTFVVMMCDVVWYCVVRGGGGGWVGAGCSGCYR